MSKINSFRLIFFWGILVLGTFFIWSQVQALIISQIYFTEFSIEKNSYNVSEEIKGNFTIWNYENSVVPDLTYRFKLLAEDEEGFFTTVLDDQPSREFFFLNPDQKLNKTFAYQLPKNLFSGDYKFRVQLFNSKGVPMIWKEVMVNVKAEGKFLTLENYWFLKDGEKISPEGQIIYNLGEVPKITFDISNQSSFIIQAYPKIIIYKYNINENSIKEIQKELITINPGGIYNKEFSLIRLDEPDSYLAQLIMYDQENYSISNSIYFRWTISGKEAEIIQIKIDEPPYQPEEEVEISVDIVAPNGTEEGDLSVKIINEEGEVVGEAEKEFNLGGGEVKIQVPITKQVFNPKIEISAKNKENEELDKYETKIETYPSPEKKETPWRTIIIGTITLILIIFIIYYFFRRKKLSSANLIFFGIILGGLMVFSGGQTALAVTEVSAGPFDNTAIIWNNPLPEYLYEAGGFVPFSGGIFIPFGFWELDNNKIEFFVGDTSEVKIKNYDTGVNKIKVIDEEKSNVIKLGEVSYPAADLVEYETALKIPADLPYLGTARFYVQFKGLAPLLWHWIIAYQEVIIQKAGEGGFEISLAVDKTEAEINEELTYTVELSNLAPCIRIPVDVIEIIDRSGSMGGQKLIDAKDAAKIFVDEMDPTYDRVGLVSYGDTSTLDVFLTTDFPLVKAQIDLITAGGWTCVSCAIKDANEEIINNSRSDAARYEVLMTDGLANTIIGGIGGGASTVVASEEAKDFAQEAADEDIVIYTVGFGTGADEILLQAIADITGGTYSFAPTGAELKEIFKAIAGALVGYSFGTKIIIDIPEEYLVVESFDPRCSFDGDVLTCEIGDLECGGETIVEPIILTTIIKSTVTDGTIIKTQAEVINDAAKQKVSTIVSILVHADNPPVADISCFAENCDGPGCQCNGSWVTYNGDNVIYKINNESTDPEDNIVSSTWSIIGYQDPWFSCLPGDPLCDMTIPKISAGDYTVKLKVEDEGGLTDTATHPITVKQDAYAGFMCSLNNTNWQVCESLSVTKDETVYFKDNLPSPDEHSSASDGAVIISRTWDISGVPFSSDNESNPSATLTEAITTTTLTIIDNQGRTDSKSHQIGVGLPLPEWIEIPPFSWLRNFFVTFLEFIKIRI